MIANIKRFDIDKIEGFNFDAARIKSEIEDALIKCEISPLTNQVNLFHRHQSVDDKSRFLDFNGSLLPQKNGTGILVHPSEFKFIHPLLKGTYTEEICESIRAHSELPISRVRLLGLMPKTCYSWHTDPDLVRYHIPLRTNPGAFFIVEDGVYQMPNEGELYSINSTKPHTAVNAHINIRRVHLVFDTFESADDNPYDSIEVDNPEIRFDTSRIY